MLSRREFLAAMATSCLAMDKALASTPSSNAVYRIPTILWISRGAESAQVDYNTALGYRQTAYLLRDVQAAKMGHPDLRLLQTASWMQTWLAMNGHHVCFNILSGLRTPQTNSRTENAAQNSLHLPDQRGVFKALDLRTKTIPSVYLGKLAAHLKQGGVGFYARDFIHMDTGAVVGKSGLQRIWRGL